MEEKEDTGKGWICGMVVVVMGVLTVLGVASFSAAYYGETTDRSLRGRKIGIK